MEWIEESGLRASDPRSHVCVVASAGTDEYSVLAARILRLMMAGVDPRSILCLTKSGDAASELSERVQRRVAAWVRMPDSALMRDLLSLGEDVGPQSRERARWLFAAMLDSGGPRTLTFPELCSTILADFSLESATLPGARLLGEREELALVSQCFEGLLASSRREGRSGPAEAFGTLSSRLGKAGAEDFLLKCARMPDSMAGLPPVIGSWLERMLGVPEKVREVIDAGCSDPNLVSGLRTMAAVIRGRGARESREPTAIIEAWLALASGERAASLDRLATIFSAGGSGPGSLRESLPPGETSQVAHVSDLEARCAELIALRDRAGYAADLADGLEAGRELAGVYAEAKRNIGAVDADDLVRAAIALLEDPVVSEWARYSLDQETSHVIVAEAHHTNWKHWFIVRALTDEFFTGAGAAENGHRTLCISGDYKQALRGSDGSDPIYFGAAWQRISRMAHAIETDVRELMLSEGTCLARPITDFVASALRCLPNPGTGDPAGHGSPVGRPTDGGVTLLPLDPVGRGARWGPCSDEEVDQAHAARVAGLVKHWLSAGLWIEHRGRAVRPEDILIVVTRDGLSPHIIRQLHAEDVPAGGIDSLHLKQTPAVRSLLAAAHFALNPDDDRALEDLLDSPLFGWTSEEARRRELPKDTPLWRHLQSTRSEETLRPFRTLIESSGTMLPYQFFETVLSGPLDGRTRLISRFGQAAHQPIDELLDAAMEFAQDSAPTLPGFLDRFSRGDTALFHAPLTDAVRVVPIASVGNLQAPIVILTDANSGFLPASNDLFMFRPEGESLEIPAFRPRERESCPLIEEAIATEDQAMLEEDWRLFYIAVTRATERLVIGGVQAREDSKSAPPSWYAISARAFDMLGAAAAEGSERTFGGPERINGKKKLADANIGNVPALPTWLSRPAPTD